MNHSSQTNDSHTLAEWPMAYSLATNKAALNEPRQVILMALKKQNQVHFRIQKSYIFCQDLTGCFFPFLNNEWSCFNIVLMLGVLGEEIQLKACHKALLFHWQELSCSRDTWCAEHQLINSLKMKLSVTITCTSNYLVLCPGVLAWGAHGPQMDGCLRPSHPGGATPRLLLGDCQRLATRDHLEICSVLTAEKVPGKTG